MTAYTVRFSVPAEVVFHIDADDEDTAADRAWEAAQEHLPTLAIPDARGVAVHADLDGIGADSVEVAR